MYRSHPVRRLCAEPLPEESVALVVEIDPEEIDEGSLTETVASLDGEVVEALGFDAYRVELPQRAVAALCEVDGLVRVETANVVAPGDAGEDV